MDEKTALTLKQKFKEYYFNNVAKIEIPTRIEEREFGYFTFDQVMMRHFSFKDPGELQAMIIKEVPNSVYYSISFYKDPSLPMHEKGWKGGELVFDIDSDLLSVSCQQEHDKWICRECSHQDFGVRPQKCPKCKATRIHEMNIACKTCLGAAKNEAIKLLEILMDDFGISHNEIDVYFSGSMGYHVSVSCPVFKEADQTIRSEIVDYVSGNGIIPASLGIFRQSSYEYLVKKLPSEDDLGWRGRIAGYLTTLVDKGEESPRDVKMKIATLYRKIGHKKFSSFIEDAARIRGAAVDPSVTTDIHRIFRLPGTLHGKTGLLKKKCDNLESFDPLEDAVAFGNDPLTVYVDNSPKFELRGEKFGPFKSESVELPSMAAIYLLGLDMATVKGE